jgi:drug/metabolite transporter (DMT)-like permease
MGVVWGASFLFIKIALGGLSFGQVAWTRLVLGGLVLALIVLFSRSRLPREPIVYLHFTVIALTFCVIPHLLFSWAEQYVTSGLASIYNATTPIMTAIMAAAVFRVEKLVGGQILGIVIGIMGVVVIIGPWRAALLSGDVWGQLACLGATLCYGFSLAYAKRFVAHRGLPATTYAFLNVGIAGLIMALATPLVVAPVSLDLPIVLSLLALGILGTGFAYVWNANVLREWGPTATSTVTYVTPVIGVLLGVLVLGEKLSWNEPVGALLVIVGILFAQRSIRLPRAVTTPVAR